MKIIKIVGAVILAMTGGFILAVFFTLPTMWLWNWLMPKLFGLPPLGLFQAFGFCMLSRLLLGTSGTISSS